MNKGSKKTLNILSKLAKAKYGNRNLVKMSVVIKEYELYEKTAIIIAREN